MDQMSQHRQDLPASAAVEPQPFLLWTWLQVHRALVLVVTFLCYATFHASRKPPAIVKTVLRGSNNATALDLPVNRLNPKGGGSNDYVDFLAGKCELMLGSWHPMALSAALHAAAFS